MYWLELAALAEYRHNVASFVFFLHYVVWQEIAGQHTMKIEMSSVLFTGESPSAHDFNMIVLNSLEIVFVDLREPSWTTFPSFIII